MMFFLSYFTWIVAEASPYLTFILLFIVTVIFLYNLLFFVVFIIIITIICSLESFSRQRYLVVSHEFERM